MVKQAGNEADEQSENPTSLDSSLETVFGPGATQLAKELENNSDKMEEHITSETEHDSDSEVEHPIGSSPVKDKRKKRVRKNTKPGDLSSIKGIKDNSGVSSEEENSESEEATKKVKKARLGGESSEIHEKDDMPHSTVVVVSFCQRAKKIRSFFQIVETFKTASYFFAET